MSAPLWGEKYFIAPKWGKNDCNDLSYRYVSPLSYPRTQPKIMTRSWLLYLIKWASRKVPTLKRQPRPNATFAPFLFAKESKKNPHSMPDRYAVIGNPIAHSKSPDIHAAFAAATNQSMSYERLLAPLGNFRATLDLLRQSGEQDIEGNVKGSLKGCNITVPFKLDAFNYATELSDRARRAGAVNTLGFDGARIWGDNTDGVGLVRDIENNLGLAIRNARVLLLGAGGAARGVAGALAEAKPAILAITNRTLSKAEEIAQHTPTMQALAVESLSKHQFDIIINATSASLSGDLPAIPRSAFAQDGFAYDMMYSREPTPFMQLAASAGAGTADGLGMLVEQAAEAFWLWRGVRPATAAVLATMKQSLLA